MKLNFKMIKHNIGLIVSILLTLFWIVSYITIFDDIECKKTERIIDVKDSLIYKQYIVIESLKEVKCIQDTLIDYQNKLIDGLNTSIKIRNQMILESFKNGYLRGVMDTKKKQFNLKENAIDFLEKSDEI